MEPPDTDTPARPRAGESIEGSHASVLHSASRSGRERAEVAERRLKAISDNATLGLFLMDSRQHCVFMNPAAEKMTGFTLAEVQGRPLHDFIHHLHPDGTPYPMDECPIDRALPTRAREQGEDVFVHKDGHFYPVAFTASPIVEDGRPTGTVIEVKDLTEERKAEAARSRAEGLAATIANNATQGLLMMDARQHCTFMNPAAERITGFTLAEVQGQPLHEYIHYLRPDGTPYPMSECPIDRAMSTRAHEQGEDVFVHKDGHFYPVAFTASPILVDGVPTGTVIELRDTTEEKQQAEERERLLRQLRQAVRHRDEFLSVAAHELKTPLTPLALRLAQLLRTARSTPPGERDLELELKSLEAAADQVRRLAVLVDGLLDVSRLAEGQLSLAPEEVDVAEVVREVVRELEPQAARAQSHLRLETEAGAVGTLDRGRVAQVVTNLLSNAIKFGAGKPVLIRLEVHGQRARLTVRDEGIGISPEVLGRIFDRFERGVSDRHYGGLGLGLYVTRQLVEAMGGSVKAESAPGQGATFTVELPLG